MNEQRLIPFRTTTVNAKRPDDNYRAVQDRLLVVGHRLYAPEIPFAVAFHRGFAARLAASKPKGERFQ
jgi:hypothetical protein